MNPNNIIKILKVVIPIVIAFRIADKNKKKK